MALWEWHKEEEEADEEEYEEENEEEEFVFVWRGKVVFVVFCFSMEPTIEKLEALVSPAYMFLISVSRYLL